MPAKSSSLSRQLQGIAAARVSIQSRHKASLLFDGREAADIGHDTIIVAGRAGLQDLVQVNPSFAAFEDSLFSESLKDQDRSLLSRSENAALNVHIELFLRMLSPHFLRKSSFKALEWLIRRFKINEQNIDAIMECILPYHETRHFVQFVRILAIPVDSMFSFLQDSVQKSNCQLDRSLLVAKCMKEPSLLKFIFDMMSRSKEAGITNLTLTSFMACIMVQYLESKPSVTDADLRIFLPPLLTLLRATDVDCRSAGQMVLVFLSTKVHLSPDAIVGLLDAATVGVNSVLLHASVLCIVTVCQNHPKLDFFPDIVYRRLIQMETFPKVISTISGTYQAENLLEPFLKTLVKTYIPNQDVLALSLEASTFSEIVSSAYLDATILRNVLDYTLQTYISSVIENLPEKVAGAGSLLRQVYEKNVAVLDTLIDLQFKSMKGPGGKNAQRRAALHDLTTSFFKGTMLESVDNKGTTLYLSIHHPLPEMRRLAIEKLQSILATDLPQTERDSLCRIARDTLMVLIEDQDQSIVVSALNFPDLTSYVPIDVLAETTAEMLAATQTDSQTRAAATHVLCKLISIDDCPISCCEVLFGTIWRTEKSTLAARILSPHLPALLRRVGINPASAEEFGLRFDANVALQQQLSAQGQIQDIPKDQVSPHMLMNTASIKFLGDALRTSPAFRTFVIQNAVLSKFARARLVGVLSLIGEIKSSLQVTGDILTLVPSLLKSLADIPAVTRNPASNLIGIIESNRIVMSGKDAQTFAIVKVVLEIIKKLSQPISWLDAETATQNLHTSILKQAFISFLSIKNQHIREHLVEKFLDLVGAPSILAFCAHTWITAKGSSESIVGLLIAKKFISSSSAKAFDYQLVIPSLLLALTDRNRNVRLAAMSVLEAIGSVLSKMSDVPSKQRKDEIYGYEYFYGQSSSQVGYLTLASAYNFVKKILGWKQEIILDHLFLEKSMHTILLRGDPSKLKYQDDVLGFLLTNIMAIGIIDAQIKLLTLLKSVDSSFKLKTLFPLVEKNTSILFSETATIELDVADSLKDTEFIVQRAKFLGLLAELFSPFSVASLFQTRSGRYLKAFCDLLTPNASMKISSHHKTLWHDVNVCALAQITGDWISGIQMEKCQVVFSSLIDLIALGDGEIGAKVKVMLKPLPISGLVVLPTLERIHQHLSQDAVQPSAKRTKSHSEDESTIVASGIALLELLQFKEELTETEILIGPLFDMLAALLNADIVQTLTEVDYLKQLILSTLSLMFRAGIDNQTLSINEDFVRIDLVVQCIRITDNPQTHNAALLLLSTIASVAPQSVLINIMPVFTFMGANILRQDDSYSFHVIQQTLKTIIPALMHHLDGDTFSVIKPIMEVFVQALPHIPDHRRLKLILLLVQTLGVEKHLGSMLALIQSNSIISSYLVAQRNSVSNEAISFGLSLLHEFVYSHQLGALIKISELQRSLPCKDVECDSPLLEANVEIKTVRRIKLQLINFLCHALKAKNIGASIAEDTELAVDVEDLHLQLIELLLAEIDCTSLFSIEVQSRSGSSDAKFSKIFLNSLQEALALVNNHLPIAMFMHVTGRLLDRKEEGIRHRSLVMLRQRLASLEGTANLDEQQFIPIMERLVSLLNNTSKNAKVLESKQLAMECISCASDLVGKSIPEIVTGCFQSLLSANCIESENLALVASTIVCLSSLCVVLGPRTVPFMPKLMPAIIKIGRTAMSAITESSSAILTAVLGSIIVFVETLPQFVSPYIGDLIGIVIDPSLETIAPRAVQLASAISSGLARHIPARIILGPIMKQLSTAISSGEFATLSIFSLLSSVIANTPQAALIEAVTPLSVLFIKAFGYRCSGPGHAVLKKSVAVEESIISVFMALVMKTNESIFRPLFLKIVDWATSDMLQRNGWSEQGIVSRQQMLYRLTERLFSELKSIFIPYSAYLLDNMVSTLCRFVESSSVDADLWILIISNFKNCFLFHSTNDFITSDRLQTILDILMKQIEQSTVHNDTYKDHMSLHLVPCIGQLAVTFRGERTWKALTRSVLHLTRSDHASIRWTCIKVLHEMYSRLGEEMLVYFPETIPFLAELMEDDDNEVEKSCQELCLLIQHYLGEPIQQYFSA
ncbi:hypothetical protein BASA60_008135 [Batrachochytrium salamandrivorans]|nr:hypothetical protein BASA60_008135 [Batrachochytrium salamandrivorans]